jgi:hypothetical protein
MNDVGKTEGKTWEKHKEHAHALVYEVLCVDTPLSFSLTSQILANICVHYDLLEKKDVWEASIAWQVNG